MKPGKRSPALPEPVAPYGYTPYAPAAGPTVPPQYAPSPYGAPPMAGGPVQAPYAAPPPSAPYNVAPPAAAPPAQAGVKLALLIGINYMQDSRIRLNGCVNDAKCVKYMLQTKFGFPEQGIILLTDEDQRDPSRMPTKANIMYWMSWISANRKAGDSIFFHFSGHGTQVVDRSGDEADGLDETILPCDHRSAGQIVDDDIFKVLCLPLAAGVRLTSIMDCCHSGTGLDLPYLYRYEWGRFVCTCERPMGFRACRADVVLFSGCRDDQTSADTKALSKTASTGAMTFCFIQAVESGRATTFASTLQAIIEAMHRPGNKFTQLPQLSSGHPLDLNQRLII